MARPTKYKGEETIHAVESIIEMMSLEKFFSFCGIEQIAIALGVCRDTIYEWCKKYDEFSDTIRAWETKRNALFYNLVPSKQVSPSSWIFLSKNWLGMKDNQAQEHSGGIALTINKVITDERPDE